VGVAQLQPSHVDDLLRVTPKMRNTVEDRSHPSHVETLNATDFRKLPGIDTKQNSLRFLDDVFKPAYQLFFRDRPTFRKLGRTIANIGCAADAGHDPLPQVAAQVQDQVADAVETRLRPPPHLLVIQLTQAVLDAIQGALQLVRRRSANGSS